MFANIVLFDMVHSASAVAFPFGFPQQAQVKHWSQVTVSEKLNEDLDFVLKTLKDNEKDPLEDAASTEPGDDAGGNVVGTSELRISTTEDEDTSQTSAVSPFKRPPDSVSVDGSFSNTTTREPSRERHMSVNSIDDQGSESRMSETNSESERRQSANEELAAQYAQQLAFYR